MALIPVTVTGTFTTPEGDDATGSVRFNLIEPIVDGTGAVIVGTQEVAVDLVAGAFSVDLYATEGVGILPLNNAYEVEEFIGGRRRRYEVSIPPDNPTIDLADFVPTTSRPSWEIAGPATEYQVSGGYIQYRPVGTTTWYDLITTAAITGPAGTDGTDGTNGAPGTDGADGDIVYDIHLGDSSATIQSVLQTATGHIKWEPGRYDISHNIAVATGVSWTDRVELRAQADVTIQFFNRDQDAVIRYTTFNANDIAKRFLEVGGRPYWSGTDWDGSPSGPADGAGSKFSWAFNTVQNVPAGYSSTVAAGSNGVNVTTDSAFVAGTGVLDVATTTNGPATLPNYITLTTSNGEVELYVTGQTSTTYTGCRVIADGTTNKTLATGDVVRFRSIACNVNNVQNTDWVGNKILSSPSADAGLLVDNGTRTMYNYFWHITAVNGPLVWVTTHLGETKTNTIVFFGGFSENTTGVLLEDCDDVEFNDFDINAQNGTTSIGGVTLRRGGNRDAHNPPTGVGSGVGGPGVIRWYNGLIRGWKAGFYAPSSGGAVSDLRTGGIDFQAPNGNLYRFSGAGTATEHAPNKVTAPTVSTAVTWHRYGGTGTTELTIDLTGHGLAVGTLVICNNTGQVCFPDGVYSVVTAPDVDHYTLTGVASGSSTGNSLLRTITGSKFISTTGELEEASINAVLPALHDRPTSGPAKTLYFQEGREPHYHQVLSPSGSTVQITFAGAVAGRPCMMIVDYEQGTVGSKTLTYSGSTMAGQAATLHTAAGAHDIIMYVTWDGGATVYVIPLYDAAVSSGGTAATTTFSPTGSVAATDVQAAIAEVAAEYAAADATHVAASDPHGDRAFAIARANHTGTQLAATISDFDTQVRLSRLDQMAAPTGSVAMGAQRITGLADGTATTDAATFGQVTAAVAGLLDYRGAYDASTNLFPATGGSGVAGALLKGDFYVCSVAGTLGSKAVAVGDLIIALVDTPAQTAANWDLVEHDLGYAPADSAVTITAGTGLTGGGNLTANRTITAADMATATMKGRITAGTGAAEDLTASQSRSNMGLGTAAIKDTGTSSGQVPLNSDLRELTAGSTTNLDVATAGEVKVEVNAPDVQTFTSGSGNWTKPAWAAANSTVEVILEGAGGGGGSGRAGATSTIRGGGGGGASGNFSRMTFLASDCGSTEAYAVGAGGAGGASIGTNDTNGAAGSAGGTTSFGTLLGASGGGGGAGGTSTDGGAGGTIGTRGMFPGLAGGNGAGVAAATAPATGLFGTTAQSTSGAGGGGGGLNGSNTGMASSAGGDANGFTTGSVTGGAGGAAAAAGTAGSASGPYLGSGGGGSGRNANGVAGGAGGGKGAGGGGGGSGTNSTTASGAGGAGSAGYIRVITRP